MIVNVVMRDVDVDIDISAILDARGIHDGTSGAHAGTLMVAGEPPGRTGPGTRTLYVG